MKNNSSTKRALLGSVLSIVLCLAMFIGTTAAWFVDSASTSVNTIQAGRLGVALEKKVGEEWVSVGEEPLTWQKKDNSVEVLWEPGCTYNLPELRIVNSENLAIKYKIIITGILGDAELNKAIDWTITVGDNDVSTVAALADYEGMLPPKTDVDTVSADTFTISGTMQTTAGNEYMGKSIDGIAITVKATQAEYEFDSFNNTYDAGAWTDLNMTDNENGTYSDDEGQLYVKIDGTYVHVEQFVDSAGNPVEGRYTDESGSNYVASDGAVKSVFNDSEAVQNDITLINNITYDGTATGTSMTTGNILRLAADTTFDLGGNTLTINSKNGKDGVNFLGGTFEPNPAGSEATIVDGTIIQNKTYGSSYAAVVAEHTTLTLENVSVTAEDGGYAVRCSGYKDTIVIMNDCTVTGKIMVGSQATLKINGGCVVGIINPMTNAVVEITSGIFSEKPQTSWLADGSTLSAEPNSDGYWVVTDAG